MNNIDTIENNYFNQWLDNGVLKRLNKSVEEYSNSGKLNSVQVPQLLKQWVERFGSEEDIKDSKNDGLISSIVIAKKMANYLANKTIESQKTGDASILQKAQANVSDAMGVLSSYSKDNHDQYSEALGSVSGFDEDLNYTTFGEQTDYDAGLQEDTSALERISQTIGDMSLTGAAKRGVVGNRMDQIERGINNELLRRGAVNESFIEKASGIVGGLAVSTIESIILSKFGGAAGLKTLSKTKMNDISKIKTGQDIARYVGQGMVLPIVQNLQDQAGLTEKYDDGSGYMKLAGDAIQNTASMFVGDQIMSPVLNAYKSKAMVQISKNYSKESIDKAIATAKAESKDAIQAVSSLLKVKDKSFVNKYINESLLGSVSKETEQALNANLGKLMKQSANAALLREWWKPTALFGAELGADLAFDIMTTTGLDMLGENLATVHQTGMYSLPEIMDGGDWKGAIYRLLQQRLGMKAGGMLINKIQSKMVHTKREELGTTASIKKELGLDKLTPTQAIMVRLNNTLFGNDMADLDTYTRDAVGESLNDMFQDDGKRFQGALAAWMYNKSANNILSIGWAESVVGGMFKAQDGIDPKPLAGFFNNSIKIASDFRQTLEETIAPLRGTEASVLEIEAKDVDRLSNIVSKRVLESLTKFTPIKTGERTKYELDKDEIKNATLRLGSFISTFNAGDKSLSDELFTTISKKVSSGLEKAVSSEASKANQGNAVNISIRDIVGADALDSKLWSSLQLSETDAAEEHGFIREMLLKEGIKSTKRFDKENAHNLYSFLATLKSGMQGEEYQKFMKDVETYQSVLPKSVIIDYQNIKDMNEMLKGFDETIKDEAGMIKEAENANGVFKDIANRMIKKYSDGIFNLVKNASNPDEPTLIESNQMISYVVRLLNLAQRVSLDADGKNTIMKMKDDLWIQKALKIAISKNSRLSELTGYPNIKELLGGDDSFNNIVSKLVNLSSNIEIGNRLFAGHYLNAPKVKDILTSWGLGIYGENDIAKNRIVNWMVDFAQSLNTENGLLNNITLDGKSLGRDWVTRFNSTFHDVYNREIIIDLDDIRHTYAIARAKAYTRERFSSFVDGDDFMNHMNNGDVKFAYSEAGASFDVDSRGISIEDMQKYIIDNSFGAIKTTMTKDNENVMNTSFSFGRYDRLSSKELFEELKRSQVADVDVDGVLNSIVKMYAYNPEAAKQTMKKFIKQLDNGLANLKPEEEASLDRFVSQQYIKNSTMNSFNLTFEVSNPKDAYMKNAVITFDQQASWFDKLDGVSSVNISYDDEFIQRVGSSFDTAEWWKHVDNMAKRGMFAVVRKGNNMDWSFIKITDVDKEGNINLGKLTDILITRLTSNKNTFISSTDPRQVKYVKRLDDMIKKLNDQKNSAIKTTEFAKGFLKEYTDLLADQYKDFNIELPEGTKLKEESVFKDKEINMLVEAFTDKASRLGQDMEKKYKDLFAKYEEAMRNGSLSQFQNFDEYLSMALNNNKSRMDAETRKLAFLITDTYDKNKAMLSPYKDDLGQLLNKGFKKASSDGVGNYKDIIKKGDVFTNTRKAERELLNFALFGDNYIAEAGHIIKRFSYSNQSNYIKADGTWEQGGFNVVENGITKQYTYQSWFKELASKYNVVFASLGGDGGCYFPRKALDQMATQPDAVQGKLVTDWLFGGMKLNAEYSERLADRIAESGQNYGLTPDQIKNSIIIDVTAFKTMLPLSKEALSALKQGDTFVKANLDNETMAKFIASMTLHSPIETAAKKRGEFGLAVMTPMHTIGKTIGRAHMVRMSRILKGDKEITWDELLDPARMFGSWRKRMSQLDMDVSASAKVATWMPLTKMDSETMDNSDREALIKLTNGKNYLPESHMSAGLIKSFFNASKSLIQDKYKKKARAYKAFWDNLSQDPNRLNDLISEFMEGGTTKTMMGEWKDRLGFVITNTKVGEELLKSNKDTYIKNPQGIVINKKYSFDDSGKVLSKNDAYKAVYDNMGKETLAILSDGDNAPFQSYDIDGRKIYMANMTRFPNERAAQNYNVVISGISPRIYGIEINDYYYRRIHGGDYDGDAIQIIGLSSKDYKQGVMDVEGKEKLSDRQTVINIINNHAESVLSKENTLVPDISPSDFEGSYTQAGAPIATLYKMQFYDSVMKLSAHSVNQEKAVINEWNNRMNEVYRPTVEGQREIAKIRHLPSFIDDSNDMRKVAFIYSDKDNLWDDMKFSHTGGNAMTSLNSIESGGFQFKVMITDVIDQRNHETQQMYLVQIDKNNDFPSMKVVSTRQLNPMELMVANSSLKERQMLTSTILQTEKANLDKYFEDMDNKEVDWSDYNSKLNTYASTADGKGNVIGLEMQRYLLPRNMSFVSKQMLTQVMNGVSVNNMKNNTLIFLLNKIGTSSNPNAMDDLISKTTVALNFKPFIGPETDTRRLVSGLGFPSGDLNKIDMKGFFDTVVNQVRKLADDGVLFNRMSLSDFDNVKKLFSKIPDANESIGAFNSLYKLMHYADKSDRKTLAQLPMQAQAGIIKFGKFLKESQGQFTSNKMDKVINLLNDEIKGLILGDSSLKNVFASKTIKRSDLGEAIPIDDPKNYEIKNPILFAYQFYSTKELMQKMDIGLWGNGNIANLFRINSNQIPIIKSPDFDPKAFADRLASEANKQGRNYTGETISKMLYNMNLSIKQSTRKMLGEEKLMEIIAKDTKDLPNEEITKLIKEANEFGSSSNSVQGFEIASKEGKSLSLEKLSEALSSALGSKHDDDRELRNAIAKAIVGMLDDDQQRMVGYYSNGMTSKIVNLIEKDKLDKSDLLSIIDAQMHSKNLKNNNITEFSNVVRDELNSRKIRGCE